MNQNELDAKIITAALALVAAVAAKTDQLANIVETEDRMLAAAAYAAGLNEADGESCLVLDMDTDWLQDAYERGRTDGRSE